MSDGLFTQGEPTTQAAPLEVSAPTLDAYTTKLASIKNERGEQKYDSLDKAIEALQHSQEYIPELKTKVSTYEQEIERLKNELDKRQTVEDVISRLTPHQPSSPEPTSQVKGLDEQAVQQMLQRELSSREQALIRQSNTDKVSSAITAKYGDKAKEIVVAKAQELGMTLQALGELSATSPSAALALFSAQSHANTSAPVGSSVRLPEATIEVDLKPTKSMLRGTSDRERAAYMKKIEQAIYQKHGITE